MSHRHLELVQLDGSEWAAIDALIADLAREALDHEALDLDEPAFHDRAEACAQELPRTLRLRLNRFRTHESACVCVIRGQRLDDDALGPTPRHWRDRPDRPAVVAADLFLYLCACLLGTPVAWSTKQDGHVVHNVAPIAGDENEQLASGSVVPLTWHTEDAFHPFRADYLGLMCLRNPDEVETTIACVPRLGPAVRSNPVLFEPRFHIVPDESHLSGTARSPVGTAPVELAERARARIARMADDPEPVALLFGDPASPYLRLDQHYTSAAGGDRTAADALAELLSAVDAELVGFALAPGDVCFLDNYKVVHGRSSFRARYDGTDRWLRRVNVSRDLRRSRDLRASPGSRLIM